MDGLNSVIRFWLPFIIYSTLLGVYLLILGVVLARLVAVQGKREEQGRK